MLFPPANNNQQGAVAAAKFAVRTAHLQGPDAFDGVFTDHLATPKFTHFTQFPCNFATAIH